jgi:uncharacterized membrane protein required for colicin V production
MRGVTAFLVAPILLYLTTAIAGSKATGIERTVWICFGIALGGFILAVVIFVLGRGRLQTPDLERWQQGEPAWQSQPLAARLSEDLAAARPAMGAMIRRSCRTDGPTGRDARCSRRR